MAREDLEARHKNATLMRPKTDVHAKPEKARAAGCTTHRKLKAAEGQVTTLKMQSTDGGAALEKLASKVAQTEKDS